MRSHFLVVIGAAALLAGCAEEARPAAHTTSPVTTTTTTTVTTTVPTPGQGATPEETWCYDKVPYNEAAPAYTGPGPHPAVVAAMRSKSALTTVLSPGPPALPMEWQALTNGQVDRNRVQLVVCAFMPNLDTGPQVGTCDYVDKATGKPKTIRVVAANYRFTVLAARTGEQVGAFEVAGSETHCPHFLLTLRPNQALGQRVGSQQFAEALRPYVIG